MVYPYKNVLRPALAALALTLVWTGCDSEAPGEGGEQELITRVTLTLTPVGGGTPVTAEANDANADGVFSTGDIDSLRIEAGTTYEGTIELRDDPNDVNITEEIEEESDVHQFFYTLTGGAQPLTVTVTDRESDYGGTRTFPVGLRFTISAPSAPGVRGGLQVRLGHFEDPGLKNGTAPGDTDVQVTFPLRVTP